MHTPKPSTQGDSNSPCKSCARPGPEVEDCSPIYTSGAVFSDGASIELIREAPTGPLCLMVSDGQNVRVAHQVEFRSKVYQPVHIDPSLLLAMRFPTKPDGFGRTAELFTEARETFMSHGFPEDVALPTTYFSFSTWFTEFLPAAPCLLLTGPPAEARFMLELLGCTVRHALPLGQIPGSGLCSLPMHLQPTLLISQVENSSSAWRLLDISNHRFAYTLRNHEFVDVYCAKAVYLGENGECGKYGDSVLRINLPSLRGRFPILDARDQLEISGKFQSKMLGYRCRNIQKVRESICDFPGFDSGIRILGRILGAPIVEAPELQADLEPLLHDCQERALGARSFDLFYVTIEALLFHSHKEPGEKVHVRKITKTVMAIFKARGETLQIKPEEIGKILRKHGFSPKRDSDGSAIRLNDRVCHYTHQLAHRFQLAALQQGITKCSFCLQVLALSKYDNRGNRDQKE